MYIYMYIHVYIYLYVCLCYKYVQELEGGWLKCLWSSLWTRSERFDSEDNLITALMKTCDMAVFPPWEKHESHICLSQSFFLIHKI